MTSIVILASDRSKPDKEQVLAVAYGGIKVVANE
jgi:hypothetical protein